MIETQRLTIRRVQWEDWRALKAIWEDERSSPYAIYDTPNETDDFVVMQRAQRWEEMKDSEEHLFYAICLKEQMIGYICLNQREPGFEAGYCFHSAFHGKGYVTEAFRAVIDICQEKGISCIIVRTALDNLPSVRLLGRLGFELVGTEKVSFYQDMDGKDIVFEGGIFELSL